MPKHHQKDMTSLLVGLAVLLISIAIYTYLVMLIWNDVIIKKFPSSNIQKLNFWDALALSVLVGLLSCGPVNMSMR